MQQNFESSRRQEDAIEAMKRAKVAIGYFWHVESILAKHPPSRWPEIMRSVRQHGPVEWFRQ